MHGYPGLSCAVILLAHPCIQYEAGNVQVAAVNALMDASRCSNSGGLFEPLLSRLLRGLLLQLPTAEPGLLYIHAHYLGYPDVRCRLYAELLTHT